MSSLCQICGARFLDTELDRNPLAHFCIGLDGPAIVHEDAYPSTPHTPELEKPKDASSSTSQQHSIQLPAPAHAKEDLIQIAQLRSEVDQLRAKMQEGHVCNA